MHERELYDRLLGLSAPWFVADVKLATASQQVDVFVEHAQGTAFCCPKCGKECSVYDHTDERQWRHLDTMQFKTMLHAKPPRVECREHGITQVAIPWAGKNSRFTLLFERLAINVLQANQTAKCAQGILGTTWNETWRILRRTVERGNARKSAKPMPHVGIDAKAFRKSPNYEPLLYDLDRSTVEAFSDENDAESGNACFSQLSKQQLDSVKAIAMDMSAAFVRHARENIPLAETKIAHDRLHIMKLVSEAV